MHLFSSAYNEYTVISKEYTCPLDFVITGCLYNLLLSCWHSISIKDNIIQLTTICKSSFTPKSPFSLMSNTRTWIILLYGTTGQIDVSKYIRIIIENMNDRGNNREMRILLIRTLGKIQDQFLHIVVHILNLVGLLVIN